MRHEKRNSTIANAVNQATMGRTIVTAHILTRACHLCAEIGHRNGRHENQSSRHNQPDARGMLTGDGELKKVIPAKVTTRSSSPKRSNPPQIGVLELEPDYKSVRFLQGGIFNQSDGRSGKQAQPSSHHELQKTSGKCGKTSRKRLKTTLCGPDRGGKDTSTAFNRPAREPVAADRGIIDTAAGSAAY